MKKPKLIYGAIFLLLYCYAPLVFAQTDSVFFHNGNFLTGEVESMEQGVFVFSTDYSDDDFTIEWEKIKALYTETVFIISLSDGSEHKASLRSVSTGKYQMLEEDGSIMVVGEDDIVNLNPYSEKFLNRLSASWDAGYSYTRSKNNMQFNARTFLGYEAELWNTDVSFNSIYSNQDSVNATRILNGTWNLRYNLPARLFLIATVNMLSDSEQELELRTNPQVGIGAYIIRSNKAYLGSKVGINRNLERYVVAANNRESWEGFMGTELNVYDVGDLDILATFVIFPGFTEKGRWRSDISFDVKYEFPMDFYISGGFSLNWDNQAVAGAENINTVFLAGLGWEW